MNIKIILLSLILISTTVFFSGCTNQDTNDNVVTDKWLFAMDTDNVQYKYQQSSYPTIVIIDTNGKVTYYHSGYHDKETISPIIEQTLNGEADILGDSIDFTVTTFNGQTFTLSEKKGKVVVIDFTGVNCYWCDEQMPELQKIQEEYGNEIILLSIDTYFSGETKQDVIDTYGKYILMDN